VTDLQDRRDRELIDDVARGSEDAFADLFRRYGAVANGLAVRVIGDPVLAEDVLQEVFLSVWRSAHTYDDARGTVRAWLLSQIHHRAVDVVRREEAERRRLMKRPAFDLADEIDDVVERSWSAARREHVLRALTTLTAEQRAVIERAYYNGMTQTQIADREEIPLGTVKSRTLGAMRALRAALGGER
jgi:RNA polymerase sigma-70 factor (ECF subfamily)